MKNYITLFFSINIKICKGGIVRIVFNHWVTIIYFFLKYPCIRYIRCYPFCIYADFHSMYLIYLTNCEPRLHLVRTHIYNLAIVTPFFMTENMAKIFGDSDALFIKEKNSQNFAIMTPCFIIETWTNSNRMK